MESFTGFFGEGKCPAGDGQKVPKKLKASCTVLGFPCGSVGKESACNSGDPGWISGLGRSPGEGNGYPRQYSCLMRPVDRDEPGGLQSMGSQRVGQDLATKQQQCFFSACYA